ncbi:putative serine/threonine-protein kinase [Aphis craccivora]|uniref:Putative serine/threonine-protein kinase n=1 Tax=Aphis craccivora TaxID=307492 RepID=A0A6G0Z618_APHCR|nr:putative serine/threonine-protein kinase [Aphis craccivora]
MNAKLQDVVDQLEEESARGRRQDEVDGFGEGKLRQDYCEISEHQDHTEEHVPTQPLGHRDDQGAGIDEPRGRLIVTDPAPVYPAIRVSSSRTTSTITTSRLQQCPRLHDHQRPKVDEGSTTSSSVRPEDEVMLQQYQQQPDYTPYGGIGYGAQPNSGYFNYAATESSWYGSPSSGAADHAQMHAGLSHNACNTNIGDSTGNFLNHGYHQASSTGASTSSAESFAANNHPVSQADMTDPMADFLGGHQNMSENDKIIKEESIDWLSTIINDEVVDHGNRPDVCDGGGGGGGGGVAGAAGKLVVGDMPCEGRESNGRLPNFHQAFGSTEIGRFSQHEYYEPPKDAAAIGECQSVGRSGAAQQTGGASQQRTDEQHAVAAAVASSSSSPSSSSFEPPRQQNRRGRAQRGGGQNRRNNKQTRTAAAAAAVAAQQYAGYDVTGAAVGRHQAPPYNHHQDPYNRNHHHHAQQQRYHQEYHHQNQQQTPYQNHQQEYYRPYDRMHYQQQQPPSLAPNQYYNGSNGNNNNGGGGGGSNGSSNNNGNRGEQSYAAGGYNNRFHSCCSTEHIARPSHHHNYGGSGQYYGDYNTYNQW